MSSLVQFEIGLQNLNKKTQPTVKKLLRLVSGMILSDLRSHSPMATGRYSQQWKVKYQTFAKSDVIAGVSFYNDDVRAEVFEYGAPVGGVPWHFSGYRPWHKGPRKLTIAHGRVWAGGVNPGFANTIGGAITPAIENNERLLNYLANEIGNAYVKGIIQ